MTKHTTTHNTNVFNVLLSLFLLPSLSLFIGFLWTRIAFSHFWTRISVILGRLCVSMIRGADEGGSVKTVAVWCGVSLSFLMFLPIDYVASSFSSSHFSFELHVFPVSRSLPPQDVRRHLIKLIIDPADSAGQLGNQKISGTADVSRTLDLNSAEKGSYVSITRRQRSAAWRRPDEWTVLCTSVAK